jgi:hypothetical protein
MTYATVQDVADRLGRAIDDPLEVAQVQAWLDDIEDQIVSRFLRGGLVLADQIALDAPTLATVIRVECAVAIRRIQNPVSGLESLTRSVDDASITERYRGPSSTWDLIDAEWGDLLPIENNINSGAFSIQPGFESDYAEYWPAL